MTRSLPRFARYVSLENSIPYNSFSENSLLEFRVGRCREQETTCIVSRNDRIRTLKQNNKQIGDHKNRRRKAQLIQNNKTPLRSTKYKHIRIYEVYSNHIYKHSRKLIWNISKVMRCSLLWITSQFIKLLITK